MVQIIIRRGCSNCGQGPQAHCSGCSVCPGKPHRPNCPTIAPATDKDSEQDK